MSHGRTNTGKILFAAIVFLLFYAIIAGEFPGQLSLADNTANDCTVRSSDSVDSPAVLNAKRDVRITEINSKRSAPELQLSRVSPFEKAEFVPSGAFVFHSIPIPSPSTFEPTANPRVAMLLRRSMSTIQPNCHRLVDECLDVPQAGGD